MSRSVPHDAHQTFHLLSTVSLSPLLFCCHILLSHLSTGIIGYARSRSSVPPRRKRFPFPLFQRAAIFSVIMATVSRNPPRNYLNAALLPLETRASCSISPVVNSSPARIATNRTKHQPPVELPFSSLSLSLSRSLSLFLFLHCRLFEGDQRISSFNCPFARVEIYIYI